MPSDLSTVEEVEAGEYTVRVAQADDGAAYEAVVVDDDATTGSSPPSAFGAAFLRPQMSVTSDDSDDETPIGTAVTAPHRWVAIGFAIEVYEWRQLGEETVDAEEAYERAEVLEELEAEFISSDLTIGASAGSEDGDAT